MKKVTLYCLFLLCFGAQTIFAQKTDTLYQLPVSEVMSLPVLGKEEETVTTASKKAESALAAPAVMSVITAKEIEAFGANNLGEVLDRATSMYLSGGTTLTPNGIIAARGVSSTSANNQLLILLNGQPVREALTNGYNTNLYRGIPVESIARIELIRGSGSVLYGSNAYRGVINILTKAPKESLNAYARLRYGQFDTWQSSVGVSKKIGKLGLAAHVLWNKTEGWDFTARGERDMSIVEGVETEVNAPQTIQMGEDMKSVLLEANLGDFSAHFFHSKYAHDYMGLSPSWSSLFDLPLEMTLQNVALSYLKKGEKWEWNTQLNYSYFRRDFPINSEGNPLFFTQEGSNLLAETSFAYTVSDNFNFLLGINTSGYQAQTTFYNRTTDTKVFNMFGASTNPDPYKSFASETEQWYCFYAQAAYKPFPFLNLDFGAQINKTASPKIDVVPRLNAVFHWQDRFFAKILYGEAFRSPSLSERWNNTRGISTTYTPFLVGGGTDLLAEKIRTTELQLSYKHKKFQLSATIFNSFESNIISRSSPSDSLAVTTTGDVIGQKVSAAKQINRGNFDSKGLELEGRISFLKKIYFTSSFSWFKVGDGTAEQQSMGMPNTMFKTGLAYEEARLGLTAGVFNSYFGAGDELNTRYKTANPEAKAFNSLSFNLSINTRKLYGGSSRAPELILNLYGTNLLNEQVYYPEYVRRVVNSVPGRAGRAFYFSVQYRFGR